MRVLITGHKGFVGQAFVNKLLKDVGTKYEDIVGVDILGCDTYSALTVEKSVPLDCREFFKKAQASDYGLIIHLAAIVGGRATIEGEPLSVATDLSIDAEFFNWVVKTGTPATKVVYFSSSAAYPINLQGYQSKVHLKESYIS